MNPTLNVLVAVIGLQVPIAAAQIAGTFKDAPAASDGITMMELRPVPERNLPGVAPADRVYAANLPQFRAPGAPNGLLVVYAERDQGGLLFVDANLNGRIDDLESTSYVAGATRDAARDVHVNLTTGIDGAPPLPFRCRVITTPRPSIIFTPLFIAEGSAEVGGRRILVRVPYVLSRNAVEIRRGMIEVDGQRTFVNNEELIFHIGDRYISIESADFAHRSFVLREHPAEAYRIIDTAPGSTLPDFSFTDLAGAARKLSDFRGRYVLLDFWGTWCEPCVRELPALKALRARFRERGFEIIGMNFEYSRSDADVKAFLAERGVDWPNAAAGSVKDLIQNRFRIMGFPTLMLVDRDGRVVAVDGDLRQLEAVIDRALTPRG